MEVDFGLIQRSRWALLSLRSVLLLAAELPRGLYQIGASWFPKHQQARSIAMGIASALQTEDLTSDWPPVLFSTFCSGTEWTPRQGSASGRPRP